MTYKGYNGFFAVDGDSLLIAHEGAIARVAGLATGLQRRVPLASLSDVVFRGASVLSNGWLAIGINGHLAPDLRAGTAASCREAVLFRRKDQAMFEALYQWLTHVVEQNRRSSHMTALGARPDSQPELAVPSSAAPTAAFQKIGPREAAPPAHSRRRREGPHRAARPTGRPVDPWAVQTEQVGVAAESLYEPSFRAIARRRGLTLRDGVEISDATAHLAMDPANPYDNNAVAVWVDDQHVGFLPRDTALLYHAALEDLADEGHHLAVRARVWASLAWDEKSVHGSVTLSMPPAAGVQPFNAFPEQPYLVLPPVRSTIQVTGEEHHMDWLRRYVADQPRHVVVSLHLTPAKVGPRSQPYDEVEVQLDAQRVGALSRQMSNEIQQLVTHATNARKVPVCRAVLKGSPLRAELTLHVARASQVTSRWLDASTGPTGTQQ